MNKQPSVYIMSNRANGTLYVGMTSNLVQRVYQHRQGQGDGFTRKYHVDILVWFELHPTMESARHREKVLKNWNRVWKIRIIEKLNPEWNDLYGYIST